MYYKTVGNLNGNVIVFLHGWGCDSSIFSGVINSLNFNINIGYVLIDFSGFGNSEEPNVPMTIYDYATKTKGILDELNINKCILVGHSFGGRVAIILSAKYNELVHKLVLVDSAGILPKRKLKYKLNIIKYKLVKLLVAKKIINKKHIEKYGSSDYKVLSNVMKKTFINVVNEDLSLLAKNIKCNTLIVWGSEDKETPMYMAKKLNKLIINSELIVFENAGHYSFLDKMADFVYILCMFILI